MCAISPRRSSSIALPSVGVNEFEMNEKVSCDVRASARRRRAVCARNVRRSGAVGPMRMNMSYLHYKCVYARCYNIRYMYVPIDMYAALQHTKHEASSQSYGFFCFVAPLHALNCLCCGT